MAFTVAESSYPQTFSPSKHDEKLPFYLNLNHPYSALPTSVSVDDYISDYWQPASNISDFDIFSPLGHQEDHLLGGPSPTGVSGPGFCVNPLDCVGSANNWDMPPGLSSRRDTIATNSSTRSPSPSSSGSDYADSSQTSPVLEPRKRPSPSRKSRKTSAESSPTSSKVAKRLPHKEVERKYRDGLNQELERLRLAVPMVRNLDTRNYSARPSKVTVLASAVDYISTLERSVEAAAKEKEQLMQILQLERLKRMAATIEPQQG